MIATVGATALPTAAEPGNGKGHGNGHSQKHDKNKSGQGKGNKGGQSKQTPQGPKNPANGGNQGNNGQGNGGSQGNNSQGHGSSQGDNGQGNGGNGDPAGNNGTVKITPIGQDDGTPQNNPHVPCGFDIEWYGFDEGKHIVSEVSLAMHAPTTDVELTPGGPADVFVGGDPATGAGTDTGFDGEATYYPTFVGEAHPQQGYHIKLTVNTPDSQGADVKHKVFWVEPCESETTPGVAEEAPGEELEEDDTEVLGEQATDQDASSTDASSTDDTEVLGEQATAGDDDTEVMGAQASAEANVPNAVDAGEEGNPVLDLVRSPLPLLVIGLGVLLAGAAFASRRRANG